jgi:hypothetical protein
MAIPFREMKRPPAPQFGETAIFVGERTTFDKYPLGCRLYVVFMIYGSIIFCPKRTKKYLRYANKRWNWSDIEGRSIVLTEEEADAMCEGNPLMFKLPELAPILERETA